MERLAELQNTPNQKQAPGSKSGEAVPASDVL